jgi:hypothetical protein
LNLSPYFLEKALDSSHADNVDLVNDSIKIIGLSGYTYDATDKYVSDVTATSTELGRTGALASKTVTNGTFDAADAQFAAGDIATGEDISDLWLFHDTGSDATSVLICHIDQDSGAAAFNTPGNGAAIDVVFAAGGIFDI